MASPRGPNVETIVENCIIAGNTGGDLNYAAYWDLNNYFTSLGHNVIGTSTTAATDAFTQPGDSINVADPLLFPLANNGGLTQTRALQASSPARDLAAGSTSTTDQRGKPLIGVADSGAFEVQAGTFVLSATNYSKLEGNNEEIIINRGVEMSGAVTVRLVTANGTATAPADYTARANTTASNVDFADGETTKTVLIPTVTDALVEGPHTFTVTLSMPVATDGASLGTPTTATVTIVDPIQVTNANDDGAGSLRQAFRDAKANPGPDIIQFKTTVNGQTLTLGSEILVDDPTGAITVDASNLAAGFTIDGGPGTNRIFSLGNNGGSQPSILTLRGLTLTGGNGIGALSGYGGGAIYNRGTLTLERCTLSGNTTDSLGGAILNDGTLTLTQCTLSGNTAAIRGGAIHNFPYPITLTQCTISGNTSVSQGGGGIQIDGGTVTMDRCIVFGNNAPIQPTSSDIELAYGTLTRVGTSLVQNLVNYATLDGSGTILTDNPNLAPLANNGGPTKTHALLGGSAALDTGDGSALTTDQRGKPIVGDPDIGAFEVQTGGVFVIDTTTNPTGYTPAEGSPAQVIVRRTGSFSGAATVTFTATAGTATLLNDFASATQLLIFDGTEDTKTVTINTTGGDAAEGVEYFNVTISAPSLGTTLGTPTTAKVFIIDPTATVTTPVIGDLANPVVTVVSAPTAGALVSVDVGGTLTVSGTATDNKGVASVQATLNGGGPVTLACATPGATSTTFTGTLPGAVAGANRLVVTATDFAGRTSTDVIRLFKVLRPLAVNVSGFGSATAGYVQKSFREVGRPLTITGTAGTGALFAGWTVVSSHTNTQLGTNATALEKNTITFIHREGLVLRANFVANPYVASAVGVFDGGITASDTLPNPPGSTVSGLETEGYASLTVQTTGAFSGSIKIDGMTLKVAGTFDHLGVARFGTSRAKTLSVARADKPSLNVALNINVTTKKVSGIVWHTEAGVTVAVSNVEADRAPFSTTNPVPTVPLLAANGGSGFYTMAFQPDNGALLTGGTLPANQFPQGYGYGTITLTKTGTITVAGTLADKTPISMSTTMSQAGTWRLFVQLYTGLQGYLAGDVVFADLAGSDFSALNTQWVCPVLDREHYPLGWAEGITVDTLGAKYTVTAGSSVVPLTQAPGGSNGNANLQFEDGLLPAQIQKQVDISGTDTVTEKPALDPTYNLGIVRTSGAFSGTFAHEDGTKPAFNGIIFQKNNTGGLGFFLTTTPTVKTYLGQSGGAFLEPQ